MLLPLLNKVCRAKPQLRVRSTQTLVALLHTRRNVGRLADLISTGEMTIKDFKDQNAQSVGVDSCQRMPLDDIPATFYNLRGRIPSCIGDKASVCLSQVSMQSHLFEFTANLTYMIASSSFIELKISNPPNFHSPLSLVKTDDARTAPCTEAASSLMNLRVD